MKRTISISLVLFFVVYLFFSYFIALFKANDELLVSFRIEDNTILYSNNDVFQIHGTNLGPTLPGYFPATSSTSAEQYEEWFELISELKMNVVRVEQLMPTAFYRAFANYNNENEEKLYLIQNIVFDEVELRDGANVTSDHYKQIYRVAIEDTVNMIHGNSGFFEGTELFDVSYFDLSKYVLAYTIGNEWSKHDVVYSNIIQEDELFNGQYFYTIDGASPFESYLAEMANYLVVFEKERYNQQSLITFISSDIVPFTALNESIGDIVVEENTRKERNTVDFNFIKTRDSLESGVFISYNLYQSTPLETSLYSEYIKSIDSDYEFPMLVSFYGSPSSRIVTEDYMIDNDYNINETEQGHSLIRGYEAIIESGILGGVTADFQDSWYQSAWNTVDERILDKQAFWHDPLTQTENFGLIGFDSSNHYVDGSIEEWDDEESVISNDDFEMYVDHDAAYIHILIKKNKPIEQFILSFDTTPLTGKNQYLDYSFDHDVDFVLHLGLENKLLVHEYYDNFLFQDNIKNLKIRPDLIIAENDSTSFNEIREFVKPNIYLNATTNVEDYAVVIGNLIEGNTNPTSTSFDSKADYYKTEDVIEVRIPYGMLNFMDPSTKQIQGNFFDSFQFENIRISDIYINVNYGDVSTDFEDYSLSTWVFPDYEQRIKESYWILKDYFSEKR
jgi:hypothetical protein